MRRALVPLLALALASAALAPARADAALDIEAVCSPAPPDCSGWYRQPVTVTWAVDPRPDEGTLIISGCSPQTFGSDTVGTTVWCEALNGNLQDRRSTTIRVDTTAPAVTGAQPSRPPDANGWYRAPVGVAFHGADATSGLRSCTATSYAGPDGAAAAVAGTCTDVAGNTSPPALFRLAFDATAPVIAGGHAARKPDHRGWYNHPVAWTLRAADALSGLDQCAPLLVGGLPSSPAAPFTGSCRDRAGNVATRTFALAYDATPPAVPAVRARPRDHAVRLDVRASPDTRLLRISRAPGARGHRRSVLYAGRPGGLTDRRVRNGRRYRYVVTAVDQAGNVSRRRLSVRPGPRLLAPAAGALLTAPPRLAWTRVRGAAYYNVQLFRGATKVLSAWPRRAYLQLGGAWRFAGRRERLSTGRYRWYVWPGYGARSLRRFGPLIASRTFTVGLP